MRVRLIWIAVVLIVFCGWWALVTPAAPRFEASALTQEGWVSVQRFGRLVPSPEEPVLGGLVVEVCRVDTRTATP